jgi:hypothetical protein
MDDVAECVVLYDVREVSDSARKCAEICMACAEKVKVAVDLLANMDNAQATLKICNEIDTLESEADRVMRSAMSKLFRDEPDARELIRHKAVYELLETITDHCEDVADLIEGFVLENS